MNLNVPSFEGSDEEKEVQRYMYYREHYFDGIDLSNPAALRTPFLHKKVTYFMDNLTPIQADSINNSITIFSHPGTPS